MLTQAFWKAVDELLEDMPESEDSVTQLLQRAVEAHKSEDFRRAMLVSGAAWRLAGRVLGPEHTDTLTSMNNLAETLRACGDLPGAEAMQRGVLEIRRRVLGPEHRKTLTSMSNLALTLRVRGDLAGAEAMQHEALEIRHRVLGSEHPETLMSLSNLAQALRARGDLAGAEAMQREALETRRRVLGPEHPDTLMSFNNLAETLWVRGDLAGAEDIEREVLETRRRVLGPEHSDTLISTNNLAETLRSRGDLASAKVLLREVLEVQRRVLGTEHPHTLKSMNNLAATLRTLVELPAAEEMLREVLEVQRHVLGPEHPESLISMNNLADILSARGDLAGAEALQRDVLETFRRELGPEHPHTLTSMHNLAEMLSTRGDLAGAEAMQRYVLDTFRRVLGPEHPETLKSMGNLSSTLRSRGDLVAAAEAADLLTQTSESIDRLRGAAGNDIAKALQAGALAAGPINITLATLCARLRKPSSDVLAALERGGGRAALDILSRAGRGAIELASKKLSPKRLDVYEDTNRLHTELQFQRDRLQQQVLQCIAVSGLISSSNDLGSEEKEARLAQVQQQLAPIKSDLKTVVHDVATVVGKLRVFDREILPESSILDLKTICSWLRPGELLVSAGYCEFSAAAVLISHGRDALSLVLSDDRHELNALDAISDLLSMGIAPNPRRTPRVTEALQRVVQDTDLAEQLGEQAITDCIDRVNQLERIIADSNSEWQDAETQGREVDRELLKKIVNRPVPALPFGTIVALARELLRVTLPDEIRTAIAKAERVILVPSGPLHDLPLSLLIEAAGIEELINTPITYTPSASVFALQRQAGDHDANGLTIAGDPDFGNREANDSSSDQDSETSRPASTGPVIRDLRDGPTRLPRTRTEAEQIAALYIKAGLGETVPLLDADASVPNLRAKAPGSRILHLASHAMLGSADDPMISSVMLAAPDQPTPDNRGLLTLEELITCWGGKLRGCELVVLSACQSTVGVEVGDSRMALPLGLLHAGARAVLASLWSVPDMPTWLLMRRFYENLLGVRHHDDNTEARESQGRSYELGTSMPATAALAEAKRWVRGLTLGEIGIELDEAGEITTAESKQMSNWKRDLVEHPFEDSVNWAAFVIIGDVNTWAAMPAS